MITQTLHPPVSVYRTAGRAAIASGVIGLIAYALLITAVTTRTTIVLTQPIYVLFRAHDVGTIIQFLLLIPVASALYSLSQHGHTGISKRMLRVGVGALIGTAVLLLLGILKITSDGSYFLSLGIFGIWLIIASWRLKGLLSNFLRWFGIVVGVGLAIFGSFFPLYAIFVDTMILHIPAVEPTTYPDTVANNILHQLIWVGSIMGVLTLPFWTILFGWWMLRTNKI